MSTLSAYRDIAITTAASALAMCLAYALTTAHKDLAERDADRNTWASQRAEEHAELMKNLDLQRAQARAEHEAIMALITNSRS
ncbi:Uncharacterised protein [Mycolicibacterium vanbaalenii]|uniref:Secreted protein n=1 Tax=Mycolicibacterium vanbaalenii TaxID=110539 RepID=A0A5S9R107_MYCVN|nr:hypothetical protein [Mycolicibacterium vanbaalenii]CAA0126562.1 Uncharacterised protein [Mycolicibacterium vanbaalenii]